MAYLALLDSVWQVVAGVFGLMGFERAVSADLIKQPKHDVRLHGA
jgi:hypothetical protein